MDAYDLTFHVCERTGKEKSMVQLSQPDERNLMYRGSSVEDIQAWLIRNSDTLSNSVPNDDRNHLEISQNLAIYGWFQWNFYTVSLVWSLTSIEMALGHKFLQVTKEPVTLEKKKRQKKEQKEVSVDFRLFEELWKGWRISNLRDFNGSFKSLLLWAKSHSVLPSNTPIVLQELQHSYNNRFLKQNGMVPLPLNILSEEIPRFRNALIHMRREFVVLPTSAINGYRQAVEIINRLWPN
jgi:hypothetical protein